MPNPMRRFPHVLSGLAVLLLASGCVAPTVTPTEAVAEVDDASVDDAGKPTKGDKDAGVGDKDDSGLGEKDAGVGDKDDSGGGVGTMDDAGSGEDAGSGTTADAGGGGMTGTPDAGGEMNACFACAQQRCAVQVNACEHTAGCAEEGECDLGCFDAAGGHFLGTSSRCVASCTKSPVATAVLLSAATCAFLACPRECLHTFTACGGDPDMGRPMEPPTSGPGCHGFAGAASH